MTATLESAWNLVSQLSPDEQWKLAERIFSATACDADFGLDEPAWQEINRRIESIDHGAATLISGEHGLRRVREKLQARRSP